jgi:hypothetical protein
MDSGSCPDYPLYSDLVSEPEHPAAKAGRLVRAVGLGIARELEKRADAPPKAPPEPPPPPPAEDTRGVVGRVAYLGLIAAAVAFVLVLLRIETLIGSGSSTKLIFRLVLAGLLFFEAVLLVTNWRGANQRLVQRVLTKMWGPRGAMNRREKSFARICRDLMTFVGILFLAAAVFELLSATIGY